MHRRKSYIVYPLDYRPGGRYATCRSRGQAVKLAEKMGGGEIDILIHSHPEKRKMWTSSVQMPGLVLRPRPT